MKKLSLSFIIITLLLLLSSCTKKEKLYSVTRNYTYFDSYESITLWSKDKDEKFMNEFTLTNSILKKYHDISNRYEENSEVYLLNHSNGEAIQVSKELIDLIKYAKEDYGVSEYFTIAIGVISDLWHPYIEEYSGDDSTSSEVESLPPDELINKEYDLDESKILIDEVNSTITVPEGISLDLGGIVKGYVSKLLIEYYEENSISYTINMARSNISTNIGNPERKDNSYRVGLKNPRYIEGSDIDELYQIISLPIGYSIVTSSSDQRYFTYNGVKYSHIINPNTHMPVTDESVMVDGIEDKIESISVILKDPALGDILSTSFFIMGYKKTIELVEKMNNEGTKIYICAFLKDGKSHIYPESTSKYIITK